MISSLRSRLWISYALLILVVLCIVIAGLVISLRQNPLLYRAVILRLNTADSSLTARIESQPNLTSDRLVRILEREATNRNVRVMAFNNDGSLMYDSQPEASQNLPPSSKLLNPTGGENINAFTFTDQKGGVWLYTLSAIEGDRSLIVAASRPEISLWQFLRDDVLRPIFAAGLIALILAILISLGLGNWIIQPIRKMITATRGIPDGEHPPVPMEGPQEIKQLAQSYNDMVQRVASNQQSQRDFLANVTHELKTPLTSIQGYAQAILDDTAQSPDPP
jgi:signal transduction histidine kinase